MSAPGGLELEGSSDPFQVDAARPLALVGLRAVGKTSVGRRLAERLGRPFPDLDEATLQVARLSGEPCSSVAELFSAGEARFREHEAHALRRILEPGVRCVLATGGGVVERPDNRAWLGRAAQVVWLRAPLELLAERIERDGGRPALLGGDAAAELPVIAARRAPLYASVAQRRLDLDPAWSVDEVVAVLLGESAAADRGPSS